MAGINVGSVFLDAYINADGFTKGIDGIKVNTNNAFIGIGNMIANEWNTTKIRTDAKMKEIFDSVSYNFANIKNDVGEKIGLAKGFVFTGVDEMTERFRGIGQYLNGDFSVEWEKAFTGIEKSFGIVWDGMGVSLKTSLNASIKLVNSFVGGAWTSVKGVADIVGNLIKQFGSLIGYSDWGFSMPEAPKIPMLAKGGIINQPTLAMVGENGKEAVMPLENNTGWIVDLANTIGDVLTSNNAINSGGSGGMDNIVRLYIDGRQLAEAMFDNITNEASRRGISVIPISG